MLAESTKDQLNEKCRLLVVDDEPDFLEIIVMLLGVEGFEVMTARDGDEAIQMLAAGARPHVLLLDQRMPRLSGTETLQAVRNNGHDVPAILVSAVHDVDKLAFQHGFDSSIRKPFNHVELAMLVRQVLHNRGIACN